MSVTEKNLKNKPNSKQASSKVYVPEDAIWSQSQGELLDKEFERLVFKEKLNLMDAIREINKQNDYLKFWNESTKKPFNLTERQILNAAERCALKLEKIAFKYLQDKLQYDGLTTLESAITQMTDLIHPFLLHQDHAKITAIGILHWFWQVKRRIYALPVKNHIAIGFISEGHYKDGQGAGKTTLVKNICKPFLVNEYEDLFFLDTTLSELTDSRGWATILKLIIIFLDDITCESKYDIGTLKSIITCEGKKGSRKLTTELLNRIKVMVSLIFTSNTANFGEVIKDKTGNRRFFPIAVKNLKDAISEDFDFLPFWKMINPEWDCFVTQEDFRSLQEMHRTKSNLQLLLEMYDVKPGINIQTSYDITAKDIKIALNKHYPVEKQYSTTQSVTKEMERLGYKVISNAGSGKNQTGYLMKFNGNSYDRWQQNFSHFSGTTQPVTPNTNVNMMQQILSTVGNQTIQEFPF